MKLPSIRNYCTPTGNAERQVRPQRNSRNTVRTEMAAAKCFCIVTKLLQCVLFRVSLHAVSYASLVRRPHNCENSMCHLSSKKFRVLVVTVDKSEEPSRFNNYSRGLACGQIYIEIYESLYPRARSTAKQLPQSFVMTQWRNKRNKLWDRIGLLSTCI